MTTINMPQLGETVVEGTILKWLKKEGDSVAQDDPLFEISTDKVDTEVPSPTAGTLTKILVQEGQTVGVGTPVGEIEAGDGAGAEPAASAEAATERPPSEAEPGGAPGTPVQSTAAVETPQVEPAAAVPAAAGKSPSPAGESPARAPAVTEDTTTTTTAAAAAPDRGPRSQILSPIVRRLAAEHGIDLSQVHGTGTGGRITKGDVMALVAPGTGAEGQAVSAAPGPTVPGAAPQGGPAQPAAPVAAPPPAAEPPRVQPASTAAGVGEDVQPISHIRRAIAQHMLASTQQTARAWTMVEVNVDHLVKLRERVKDAFERKHGVKLTYLPFVVRATVDALREYPEVNARLDGDNIVLPRFVNMGIAVSYDDGLIVPVIKGADTMNSIGIARAIAELAARARAHQLKPDEVQGATFTITNPGPYGSIASVPIINQPNTGILSLDAIVKRPVVVDDAIAIRSMVNISMSWDHRTIDGELATRFLARVRQDLESWDFAEDLGI
jgi:pyruvate dehydrogenase E2 component (dihydrolipoamide acetyltransferase)